MSASRILPAILIALSMPLLTVCSVSPKPPLLQRGLPRSARPAIEVSRLEQRIHILINRERKARGLSALGLDDALVRIARGHSRDMAQRRYFAHESPDGHDFSYRYRNAGYACAISVDDTVVYLGAENIALNNRAASVTTVNGTSYYNWNSEETIALTTVKGWMDSTGHRRNILTPYWKREGIGVYIAPDDRIYITQNFC
jgi:uncharacterized protein YkwD